MIVDPVEIVAGAVVTEERVEVPFVLAGVVLKLALEMTDESEICAARASAVAFLVPHCWLLWHVACPSTLFALLLTH